MRSCVEEYEQGVFFLSERTTETAIRITMEDVTCISNQVRARSRRLHHEKELPCLRIMTESVVRDTDKRTKSLYPLRMRAEGRIAQGLLEDTPPVNTVKVKDFPTIYEKISRFLKGFSKFSKISPRFRDFHISLGISAKACKISGSVGPLGWDNYTLSL